MSTHNPANERIKRQYFAWVKEAKRHGEASVDAAAAALARFEAYTKFRDFKQFHVEQAVAFKRHLAEQRGQRTARPLSKATLHSALAQLKRFFEWLAGQPGYKSKLRYSDAEYFNVSENDSRIATARRQQPYPTVEQVRHVLSVMPTATVVERRNRAVIAFALLTGCRDGAIASLKLKHVDLNSRSVFQDAREVRTKFRKTFTTNFVDVGDDVRAMVADWVEELRAVHLWGSDDALFAATQTEIGADHRFTVVGIKRDHWKSASPIRRIFRDAFKLAGLPYFHPHTFRKTLAALALSRCRTAEEFKAFSQSLGHDDVLTTFTSYGAVSPQRQAEIMATLRQRPADQSLTATPTASEIAKAVARELGLTSPENR